MQHFLLPKTIEEQGYIVEQLCGHHKGAVRVIPRKTRYNWYTFSISRTSMQSQKHWHWALRLSKDWSQTGHTTYASERFEFSSYSFQIYLSLKMSCSLHCIGKLGLYLQNSPEGGAFNRTHSQFLLSHANNAPSSRPKMLINTYHQIAKTSTA